MWWLVWAGVDCVVAGDSPARLEFNLKSQGLRINLNTKAAESARDHTHSAVRYTGWLGRHGMSNPFMARAIQLSIENVQSGRGGPFGTVIVQAGNVIAEGVNQVTLTNDPPRMLKCSPSVRPAETGTLRIEGLRALYLVRALSHVPGGDLLGAPGPCVLWKFRGRRIAEWRSTIRLSTAKSPSPRHSAKFR